MASAPRYSLPPPQESFRLPSLKDLNFQYRSRPPPEDTQDVQPSRVHQWARSPVSQQQQQQPSPPLSASEQYASKHDPGGYLTPGVPMSVQQQQQQPAQQPARADPKRVRSSSRQSQASLPPFPLFRKQRVARPRQRTTRLSRKHRRRMRRRQQQQRKRTRSRNRRRLRTITPSMSTRAMCSNSSRRTRTHLRDPLKKLGIGSSSSSSSFSCRRNKLSRLSSSSSSSSRGTRRNLNMPSSSSSNSMLRRRRRCTCYVHMSPRRRCITSRLRPRSSSSNLSSRSSSSTLHASIRALSRSSRCTRAIRIHILSCRQRILSRLCILRLDILNRHCIPSRRAYILNLSWCILR
ncbi:hypothetical protein DFH07DRAFT_814582 [Mycena maculata]|uniref:Uncharacterized protein n=1 Tax=Mycena maculata TaxID=230809 RepID=A0AAD7JD64_9AGAR|nr:hypothetical protein DFH07DRAFT_814582 [Mycena maculata]